MTDDRHLAVTGPRVERPYHWQAGVAITDWRHLVALDAIADEVVFAFDEMLAPAIDLVIVDGVWQARR